LEGGRKDDPEDCTFGVPGEMAVGKKKGSIVGRVTAVCIAVRNRRGPTGFGIIITSGKRAVEPCVGIID